MMIRQPFILIIAQFSCEVKLRQVEGGLWLELKDYMLSVSLVVDGEDLNLRDFLAQFPFDVLYIG